MKHARSETRRRRPGAGYARLGLLGLVVLVPALLGAWRYWRGERDADPHEATPLPPRIARTETAAATGRASLEAGMAKMAERPSAPRAALARGDALRYLAIGGGSEPSLTQVSLEQDLRLAQQVLPAPGRVLFGGGPGSQSVQELEPVPEAPLRRRLGELFAPRGDRDTRYRAARIDAEPATQARVEAALQEALQGDAPLLLFVAAHGERGETPRDNLVALWGGGALGVEALAALHDAQPRPLRAVIASCYAGGFAELAFAAADPAQGAAQAPRCGLFAGTWDQETSGCDPDPDRRSQEGYSLHFLHALAGQDRHGQRLAPEAIDFDGDGRIGLLEAHTRARIASRSLDVPTSTSERYLREVSRDPAGVRGSAAQATGIHASLLPEEQAVVQQLGHALDIGDEGEARDALARAERALADADASLADSEVELAEAYPALAIRLLERWPMLDDPWHPRFERVLADDAEAIRAMLDASPEAERYQASQRRFTEQQTRFLDLQVEHALRLRLVRAYETLRLASALAHRGGQVWQRYQALLACERTTP